MNFILFGVILLFANVANVFGDHQILIEKLTSEYLPKEKSLWKKIDTQLILLDRGSLLNEIYREHSRIFNEFGENNELSEIKLLLNSNTHKHDKLISTVQSIDTNVKNIKEYLSKGQYAKLTDLAKNAVDQIQNAANDLYNITGKRSFWVDLVNVSFFLFTNFITNLNMLNFLKRFFTYIIFLDVKQKSIKNVFKKKKNRRAMANRACWAM